MLPFCTEVEGQKSTDLASSSASLGIDLSSYLLSTVGGLSAGGPRAAGVFFAEDCGEPGASVCPHPTAQPHPHGA